MTGNVALKVLELTLGNLVVEIVRDISGLAASKIKARPRAQFITDRVRTTVDNASLPQRDFVKSSCLAYFCFPAIPVSGECSRCSAISLLKVFQDHVRSWDLISLKCDTEPSTQEPLSAEAFSVFSLRGAILGCFPETVELRDR